MKKRAMDGLPGLTMQGTKGKAGKRGYTTFFNYNDKYSLYELDEKENPIFNTKVLGFYASDGSEAINSAISITVNSFDPIVNDHVLCKEEDSLLLYEISDVINVDLFSAGDLFLELTIDELKSKIEDTASIAYIVKTINSILALYREDENAIIENNKEVFKNYSFCILTKLDSLTYENLGGKGSAMSDLEVTVSTRVLTYPEWQGRYNTVYKECDSHTYTIQKERTVLDSTFLIGDDNGLSNTIYGEDYSIDIDVYDASTDELIGQVVTLKAFNYTNRGSLDVTNLENENNGVTLINNKDDIYGVFTKYALAIPPADEEGSPVFAKLLQVKADGYVTGYFVLANMDSFPRGYVKVPATETISKLNLYLVPIPKEVSSVAETFEIEKIDKYPVLNTGPDGPCVSETDEEGKVYEYEGNIACISFATFSNMTSTELEKLAVFAHFYKPDSTKICSISTVRNNLWNKPEGMEGFTSIDEMTDEMKEVFTENRISALRHKRGMITNYTPDLNFDNEDLGDFTIIVKYFDEGNNEQLYNSNTVIPVEIATAGYKIELYAYYKSSNASYQKIYLGEAQLEDTIE